MSYNGDPLTTDERLDSSTSERATKKQKAIGFPGRHANGASHVYRRDLCYRDNSPVLETLFNHNDNALCFTRPMQLGKSVLFSLANEVYSRNEKSNVDSDLGYSPGETDRNTWYVLRVNFGAVCIYAAEEDWELRCKALDKEAASAIRLSVIGLLNTRGNEELYSFFRQFSENKRVGDMTIGTLINTLTLSINKACGRLLVLVDEYDQPMREGLLRLIPLHGAGLYADVKDNICKDYYPAYFGFFKAIKVALDQGGIPLKIWLTGILPIGIKEMSGLHVVRITFSDNMANAVGLAHSDVQRMLDQVHERVPFQDGEREKATCMLQQHFSNLGFPGGEPLYHTALINGIMSRLQDNPRSRQEFLEFGRVPKELSIEPVSSCIFDVLCTARNLRHVVNKLVAEDQLQGYGLNYELSLEDLLQPTIAIGDYLTLLVHVGVVSATTDAADAEITTFHLTSGYYRKHLLEPILKTLTASLEKLVSYTSTEDLYRDGEDILVDFVTSISKNNMARLMAWASSDSQNHILELQFQGHITTEAHDILAGVAQKTQEDRLPGTGKRTDVTFSSPKCVVVLELKQVPKGAPAEAFIAKAHDQLERYVEIRLQMETETGRNRPVAGFVVIMYNDGASYVVQKLRGS